MDDAEEAETGSYHRYDGKTLVTFGGRAAVTNGPSRARTGRASTTIDTAQGIVRVHALGRRDRSAGAAHPVRGGLGQADGLKLDAEGQLWICHYGGSRITRFRPDGTVERVVPIPTALVTKCAFGGPGPSRST